MYTPQKHDYIGLPQSSLVENGAGELIVAYSFAPSLENAGKVTLNLKETELTLGHVSSAPASEAQVVGWPPIRSFRKNTLGTNLSKSIEQKKKSESGCHYVKVSMDGAPYLRKIDLKTYSSYVELSMALEKMFSCFTIGQYGHGCIGQERLSESNLTDLLHGSEYVLTFEDKDDDWMLVGDVPWEMFTDSCNRMRIMRGPDAIGLSMCLTT